MPPSEADVSIEYATRENNDSSTETGQCSFRDSIVTIRLSDSTLASVKHECAVEEPNIESSVERPSSNMVDLPFRFMGKRISASKEEDISQSAPGSPLLEFPQLDGTDHPGSRDGSSTNVIQPEDVKVMQGIHRQSMLSSLSAVDEGHSDTASVSIRSRSDSSGTFSSLGSANVDWSELEKKEEEAPKDETSDEVGLARKRDYTWGTKSS